MALIGLKKIVIKPRTAANTYDANKKVTAKAISANLTINRATNPLYADDAIAENDNGITSMSIELNVDDLSLADQAKILGIEQDDTNQDKYYEGKGASPYCGVAYCRVRMKDGALSYEVVGYPKVQFSMNSETAQTKADSITWQTPTLSGTVFFDDEFTTPCYRIKQAFDSEALAVAAVETILAS